MTMRILSAAVLGACLLAGCQSYQIVQKNVFSDEDGDLVVIEYGRAESDHINTFIVPATGKEMEFKSRLLVRVTLPNGDDFKAWQCMNFQTRGTMYKTDNERWQVLVNGFTCFIFRQVEGRPHDYQTIYRGVICDTPQIEVEKDDRWKVVPLKPKNYQGETR